MTPERWTKVRQTFEAALDKPLKDRVAFLHFVCGKDEDLRREVESLLKSHQESEDFLATPAVDLAQFIAADDTLSRLPIQGLEERATAPLTDGVRSTGNSSNPASNPASGNSSSKQPSQNGHNSKEPADPAEEDLTGNRVGPYEFERCIGRGGMGSVWLATRSDHEFKKRVAVKVVRRGMDSHEILRRFKLERQVLANLEHPNIARLIDGGSTADGMPFLVMEYVEGIPIDKFCEQKQLPVNARLELFRAVCSSVQYAHQNLTVHRDIKANNILVNAEGIPKLLDFGIAKLMRSESATMSGLSMDLSQTLPHLRPMTLDYASPEQVRGDAITTTTDVYSLGVLLYKLLCGRMPYGPDSRSFATMQYAIREMEPLRPSEAVMLAEAGDALPLATGQMKARDESRERAKRRLRVKLAGDLDAIVLKAMSKAPAQRYSSAEQLSEDIRRFLERMPVRARLGTPAYVVSKLIRRNMTVVIAASVLSAAMLLTTVLSYRYGLTSSRARVAAETKDLSIQRKLMHAQNDLGLAKLAVGDYAAAYSALNGAVEAAQDLGTAETAAGGQPSADTRMILAQSNQSLGKALFDSGAVHSALERYNKAQELFKQILAAELGNVAAKTGVDASTQAIAKAMSPMRRTPNPMVRTLPAYEGLNLGTNPPSTAGVVSPTTGAVGDTGGALQTPPPPPPTTTSPPTSTSPTSTAHTATTPSTLTSPPMPTSSAQAPTPGAKP